MSNSRRNFFQNAAVFTTTLLGLSSRLNAESHPAESKSPHPPHAIKPSTIPPPTSPS